MIRTDPQHSHVDIWITANEASIKSASIRECYFDASRTIHHVGIGEDLTVRSKNEARAKAPAILRRWSIPGIASPLALYINTHNSRSDTLSSRRDGMRIRIHCLCIPIICIHAQSYFLVEPISSCCLRGDDSMNLIEIISH